MNPATALIPAATPQTISQPNASAKFQTCAAPGCTNGWKKLWRRRMPIFEDGWPCSAKCLQAVVRAAVDREAGDTEGVPAQRHRVPLGLVLLAQGWITHPQLQAALSAQRASGRGRIGDWLAQSCGLEEDRITRGLGVQSGCPVLTTEGCTPQTMALVMPRRFIAEFGLVPLRLAGNALRLAFEDQLDARMAAALQQMTGLPLETGLLSARQFAAVRADLLAGEAVPVTMGLTRDAEALSETLTRLVETLQPSAARLVRVERYYWLRLWLNDASAPGALQTQTHGVEDHLFLVA